MDSLFRNVDMFGLSFTLNTFGKAKYKTKSGGGLTLFSLCIVGLFTYLFGLDFFFKENPNLVESNLVHLETKKVDLDYSKLAFMFRLENGSSKPFLDQKAIPQKLQAFYFHYKKNKESLFELMCSTFQNNVKLCSETNATKNLDLLDERLDQWFCWDIEKITSDCRKQLGDKDPNYVPFLGGYNDELEYSALRLDVNSFTWNKDWIPENVATNEQIAKLPGVILNIRFPNISYDANKPYDPLTTFYDTKTHYLFQGNVRRELRFMQLVTSIDDHGWVFQSKSSVTSMMPDRDEPEFYSFDHSKEGPKNYYNGFIRNVKKEKVFSRSFMKLQGLAAEVGGVVKSIIGVFAIYALYMAQEERDNQLEAQFYSVKTKEDTDKSELQQNNMTNVNSIVNLQRKNTSDDDKCRFWTYLLQFCWRRTEEIRQARIRKQMRAYMHEKMDVSYLFKVFEQFSLMKELFLTDEQKELVDNKTEVQVEA